MTGVCGAGQGLASPYGRICATRVHPQREEGVHPLGSSARGTTSSILLLRKDHRTGTDPYAERYVIIEEAAVDQAEAAPIRLLIADDQRLVRTGFRVIIGTAGGIDVVGEAADGVEAIERAVALQPDVVLMDIRMPRLDGLQATRTVLSRTKARVLILTTFDSDEYVYEALRAGASGFLLKDAPAESLIAGIRVVADGEALLAPSITRRLIEEFARGGGPAAPPPGLDELTPRELDVFKQVARGLSNAEIASELIVSETTVKTHVARMLMKLGLRDRVQAVVLAYEAGIVTPGAEA